MLNISQTSFSHQRWHVGILLVFPLLLTLINPNWLYNASALNDIDPWIYHALFRYWPDFATAPHLEIYYFADRLSWVLPGYALYQIFLPEIANAVLHFGVYYLAVFSIYGTARRLFGQEAAFMMGLCLGGYTWFLRAVGHDYLDGIGIAYYSTGLWLATQAVYQRRYKFYLVACGAVLMLTLATQLFWAAFIPLIGLYYLVLNAKHERHPFITSIVWVCIGIVGTISVLMVIYWGVTGEWNIFHNSVMAVRASAVLKDEIRLNVINGYGQSPMTWMVLPCVVAILAAITLRYSKRLDTLLNTNLRFITGGFCLTLLIFIAFHLASAFQYLIVYLYMSMVIPVTFLLLAGVIAVSGVKMMTPNQMVLGVGLNLIPFLMMIVIEPLEMSLLNPALVWPVIVIAVVLMGLGGFIRREPLLLVSGFAVMSLVLGGGNGIAYHDRLQNYRLFRAVDETIGAITTHLTLPEKPSNLDVWFETRDFMPYAKPLRNLYWGGSVWFDVQKKPDDSRLMTSSTQEIVMLSDNPAIVERVRTVLDGYFRVEFVSDFMISSADPTGVYQGYILRLERIDE
jgi:hypothetical protein